MGEGQHCGIEGKAATSSASIPYGCQFESWLLHFRSSSLLWPGKAVEDGTSPWAPAPMWETWKKLLAPDSWLQICAALAIAANWRVSHPMEDLPPAPRLSSLCV